jgi:hypothetical protein
MSNYRIKIEDGINKSYAFNCITNIISCGLIIRDGIKTYPSKYLPNKELGDIEIISTSTLIDAEITYVFTVLKPLEKQYKRA